MPSNIAFLLPSYFCFINTFSERCPRELRRTVLRKNKAVQLERRLRQRTEPLRRELGRLGKLTADAQESTEDRFR